MNRPDLPSELARRRRVFWLGAVATGVCELAAAVFWFARLGPRGVTGAVLLLAWTVGTGWTLLGLRWVKAAQPEIELTAEQGQIVTHSRRKYVKRFGMLGFGLAWGTFMAVDAAWGSFAHLPFSLALLHLLAQLAIWIPAGLLAGYVWGLLMWRMLTPFK